MNEINEDSFENKSKKVREHLMQKGSITTWEAITLYGVTRLSAIIFDFRKHLKYFNNNYVIVTEKVCKLNKNGKKIYFGRYIYLTKEELKKKQEQDLNGLENTKNLTQTKQLI